MSETAYTKGACQHCSGHIEFPAEAAGQSVACPHCGSVTLLQAAAAAPTPRRPGSWKWIAVVLLFLVLGGGAFVAVRSWLAKRDARDFTAQVRSFERAALNNPGAITGVVENRARSSRRNVRVEIDLIDAQGGKLWSASAFAPVIEPGQPWNFRASVVDPNAVTARVARVVSGR